MPFTPLSTMIVGSYSKPKWLYNPAKLMTRELDQVWVPSPEVLQFAQDDATVLAVREQEAAGMDIVTDGEQRRESFAAYFYKFGGVDRENPDLLPHRDDLERGFTTVSGDSQIGRAGQRAPVVSGPLTWEDPISLEDLRFLRSVARTPTKMTVLGPITASCRLVNRYYADDAAFAFALADVINLELRALDRFGVDVIQIDEPDVHMRRTRVMPYAQEAIDRALRGISAKTCIHICYGYSIAVKNKRVDENFGEVLSTVARSSVDIINLEYEEPGHAPDILTFCGDKIVAPGLINLGTEEVATPEYLAGRIRDALQVVPADRLMPTTDCGMWFLPREVSFNKLSALSSAVRTVRDEIGAA